MFAWARARGVPLFERDRTLWPGIVAGLLFCLEFVLMYLGLEHTTASRGVVLLYLAPFVVAFGAHYLIPGDRLTVAKVTGPDGSARRAGRRHGRGASRRPGGRR